MSNKEKININCPRCSKTQNVIVWTSLNVTINPEAKEDLLNKRINVLLCEDCDAKAQVDIQILYHDMEREFCAMYLPFSTIHNTDLSSSFNKTGRLKEDNEQNNQNLDDYMNDIHLVLDMDELIRYISFRDKLFEDEKAYRVKISNVKEKLF